VANGDSSTWAAPRDSHRKLAPSGPRPEELLQSRLMHLAAEDIEPGEPTAPPASDARGCGSGGENSISEQPERLATGGLGVIEVGGERFNLKAPWLQDRIGRVFAAYNFFFEDMLIKKGLRLPPFSKEEVQEPLRVAAEVVAFLRARLEVEDLRGRSCGRSDAGPSSPRTAGAMDFLWGWDPGLPPSSSPQVLEQFIRGLAIATQGAVGSEDMEAMERYIRQHPVLRRAGDNNDELPRPQRSRPTSPLSTSPRSPPMSARAARNLTRGDSSPAFAREGRPQSSGSHPARSLTTAKSY